MKMMLERVAPALLLGLCLGGLPGCGGSGSSSTSAVSAPTITTQPASQSISTGSAATFSVVASGSGTLAYQWYKDGSAVSGATSATYTISSAASTDAGSFYVVVSNSGGSVTSSTATLTVSTT